jgi:hypothetical protein
MNNSPTSRFLITYLPWFMSWARDFLTNDGFNRCPLSHLYFLILQHLKIKFYCSMVGHETTGGSLVFILWELARQPAIPVIKIVSHLSLQPMAVPKARTKKIGFGVVSENSWYLSQFFTNSHKNWIDWLS